MRAFRCGRARRTRRLFVGRGVFVIKFNIEKKKKTEEKTHTHTHTTDDDTMIVLMIIAVRGFFPLLLAHAVIL